MTDLSVLAAFLGGLGAGSVLTAIVQHALTRHARRRDVLFEERNEVFKGLLSAFEALEVSNSLESKKRFGYWATRLELVASPAVTEALIRVRASEPGSGEREVNFGAFLRAMRADLGVAGS